MRIVTLHRDCEEMGGNIDAITLVLDALWTSVGYPANC